MCLCVVCAVLCDVVLRLCLCCVFVHVRFMCLCALFVVCGVMSCGVYCCGCVFVFECAISCGSC